jgi:hypothetical protein
LRSASAPGTNSEGRRHGDRSGRQLGPSQRRDRRRVAGRTRTGRLSRCRLAWQRSSVRHACATVEKSALIFNHRRNPKTNAASSPWRRAIHEELLRVQATLYGKQACGAVHRPCRRVFAPGLRSVADGRPGTPGATHEISPPEETSCTRHSRRLSCDGPAC